MPAHVTHAKIHVSSCHATHVPHASSCLPLMPAHVMLAHVMSCRSCRNSCRSCQNSCLLMPKFMFAHAKAHVCSCHANSCDFSCQLMSCHSCQLMSCPSCHKFRSCQLMSCQIFVPLMPLMPRTDQLMRDSCHRPCQILSSCPAHAAYLDSSCHSCHFVSIEYDNDVLLESTFSSSTVPILCQRARAQKILHLITRK